MEEAATLLEVIEVIQVFIKIFDSDGDGELDGDVIPPELIEMLGTLSDGEQGNNDIENILVDIRQNLMYDEENTAISEVSARMEVIDTRLDEEFKVINTGFSFIITALIILLSWKFFGWIMRLTSV